MPSAGQVGCLGGHLSSASWLGKELQCTVVVFFTFLRALFAITLAIACGVSALFGSGFGAEAALSLRARCPSWVKASHFSFHTHSSTHRDSSFVSSVPLLPARLPENSWHCSTCPLQTKPASRLQRQQPRTQPRPFSSSGCLGLKRTTPAPAATWVRDYIDATVREFAGTPETASRLGFSMGRTRWTKAGLREATMRESVADPASKRALMEKAQN